MTFRRFFQHLSYRHGAVSLTALCLFALCMLTAFAVPRKRKAVDDRVYLVHADELKFDMYGPNPDAQIVKGHVHFLHRGATLTCDSAYFYQTTNSVRAMGHVHFRQPQDNITLTCQRAWYDGEEQLMEARNNVVLHHARQTLYTDSLNYDRLYNNAYFFRGGRLIDGSSKLSSDWGEYNTKTKMSVFNYDVKMKNPDFFLTTDTLYYDTHNSMAHIVGPSDITSGDNHIYSEQGYYDTKLERARLMNRSVLNNNGKMLVGDSVYYDSRMGFSQAFFNVVYVDSVNRNKLTGNYGEYYENTGFALCTDSAVAIDYSQGDSLFMHADTFKIVTFNIDTDSMYRKIHAFHHVRAYRRDVQAVCDSLVYNSLDSCMTLHRDPIMWNNGQQLVGDIVHVYMRDSVIDHAHIVGNAFSIQQLKTDTACYNQLSSKELFAYFIDGEIHEGRAKDKVLIGYFFEEGDSVPIIYNYQETSELRMFFKNRKVDRVWTPKTTGTMYPLNQIPADRRRLPGFMWYDYIRPRDRYDIFNWRSKNDRGTVGSEVKMQNTGKEMRNAEKDVLDAEKDVQNAAKEVQDAAKEVLDAVKDAPDVEKVMQNADILNTEKEMISAPQK